MKTALITGSTKGIGKQIGIDLLDKDYNVFFNGHTDKSVNILYKELLTKSNWRIILHDLSILENNIYLAKELKKRNIKLDVLILNIGATDRTSFGEISYKNWKKVFDTNLNFPFILIQELIDTINNNGKIIFIGSVLGKRPDGLSISYCVSKGAIEILVPLLAKEFASRNITVNAIAPGFIDTDWHDNKSPQRLEDIKKKHLLNRLGTTKEVSKAVMSIIENDFITGTVIRVDGGYGWK